MNTFQSYLVSGFEIQQSLRWFLGTNGTIISQCVQRIYAFYIDTQVVYRILHSITSQYSTTTTDFFIMCDKHKDYAWFC